MPFLIPIAVAAGSAIASAATAVGSALGIGAAGAAAGGGLAAAGALGSGAIGTGLTAGALATAGATSGVVSAFAPVVGGAVTAGTAATGGGFLASVASALPWVNSGMSLLQGVSGMITGNRQQGMAEQEAAHALQAGRENANRQRAIDESKMGTMRNMLGASGTDVNAGSSLMAYLDATKTTELNYRDEIYRGRLNAYKNKVEGMNASSGGFDSLLSGIGNAGLILGKTLLTA